MEARFSTPVQAGPGAHPASSTTGTGFFLWYSGRSVVLTISLIFPGSDKFGAISPPPGALINHQKEKSHGFKSGDLGGQRNNAWSPAAGMMGNGSSVWLLTCHTKSTYEICEKFLFPSVAHMFTIHSAIQVYRFH